MIERVKMDIDFQDREVPIYTSFEGMEDGCVVLYGFNLKNFRTSFLHYSGSIMGKDGFTVDYLPKLSIRDLIIIEEKLKKLPTNSLVWLSGKHQHATLFVEDSGKKEDFNYVAVLDKLTKEFKDYLDPEVFTYYRKFPEGVFFEIKGRVKLSEDESHDVSLFSQDGKKVGTIADNKEKFVPFDNKLIRFEGFVPHSDLKEKQKQIYPVFGSRVDFLMENQTLFT
jgi:hypothetical protein